ELMRSHANYRGKQRLERWGDRMAAQCVMRYARAVSLRNRHTEPDAVPEPTSERAARTFEQYLGMLDPTSRQILLLRHALGFSISELAELVQCSPQGARERLLAARRAFRALVRRREARSSASDSRDSPLNTTAGIGLGAQRWCALRDREALGEPLLPEEIEEVALLEAKEPETWAYVAQVRALELYFDPRTEPRGPIDGTMVQRAVEVIKVSSSTMRPRALVDDSSPHESRVEQEGANWIGVVAWSVSAALALASGLALYFHRPEPALVAAPLNARSSLSMVPVTPAPLPPPKPTVESLPSARTAARGARLQSGGRALQEGTLVGQGDTVEALDRPGCVQIEPAFEACLAPGTALTLSSLQAGARQLTLVRGRVVVRGNEQNGSATIVVRSEGVEASTDRGAFAFERASDGTSARVRALRGRIALATAREQRSFEEGQGAQVRVVDGTVSIAPVASAWLQRDWDVLAIGLHAVAALPTRPLGKTREEGAKPEPELDREPGVSPAIAVDPSVDEPPSEAPALAPPVAPAVVEPGAAEPSIAQPAASEAAEAPGNPPAEDPSPNE
ncbi:MAG TPA: sigma factor-like helix-turn-helix DNA-binding protein, partial [Polyangiales bacterium]